MIFWNDLPRLKSNWIIHMKNIVSQILRLKDLKKNKITTTAVSMVVIQACKINFYVLLFCKNLFKRLLHVGFYIINMLDTDRYAKKCWRNTGRQLFLVCQLLMCSCSRLYDQSFGITDIRKV